MKKKLEKVHGNISHSAPITLIIYTLILSSFLNFVGITGVVHANVPFLPRTPEELFQPKKDTLIRLKEAEVAYINLPALHRDFPQLRQKSSPEIKQWILDNFAYISIGQLQMENIRTGRIPVEDPMLPQNQKTAYRPLDYGRAAVVPAFDDQGTAIGLVDIKGIGLTAESPKLRQQIHNFLMTDQNLEALNELRLKDHSDGMMSLGEAVAELTRQQAAQKLFDIRNAQLLQNQQIKGGPTPQFLQTVETYFLIATHIPLLKENGTTIPTALYGRQAHLGRDNLFPVPQNIYTDEHGSRQSEFFRKAAVDWGGVGITDSRLEKSFGLPAKDPQQSLAWKYGHQVADAYMRPQDPDKEAISRHLQEMLSPLEQDWLAVAKDIPEVQHEGLSAAVTKALQDFDPKTRFNIALALDSYPYADLEEHLATALEDTHFRVRKNASLALAHYQGPKNFTFFSIALSDSDPSVYFSAAEAFASSRDFDRKEEIRSLLEETFLNSLEDSYDFKKRYHAWEHLPFFPGDAKKLFELIEMGLNDPYSSLTRAYGALALGKLSQMDPPFGEIHWQDKILGLFTKAFQDKEAHVQIMAAMSLSKIQGPKLVDMYVNALNTPYPEVYQKVVNTLYKFPNKNLSSFIAQLIQAGHSLNPQVIKELQYISLQTHIEDHTLLRSEIRQHQECAQLILNANQEILAVGWEKYFQKLNQMMNLNPIN